MTTDCSHLHLQTRRQTVLRCCITILITSLLIASYFVPGPPLTRALVAFVPIVALLVLVEWIASPGKRLRSRKRWRIRPTQKTPGKISRHLLNILTHALIASVALQLLRYPPHFPHLASQLFRLAAGAILLYGWAATIAAAISLLFLIAGYALPVIHRHPVAARNVEEFWARRWNITVSAWLHAFVFLPCARRHRPRLGILLAFLVSGAYHGWLVLSALGAWAAFTTTLFFTIQGPVILLENRLRVHQWPAPLARAWTITIILGASPLFIDPALQLFGL